MHGHLISFLYLLGVDRNEIEDVAQNVAIQVHGSLGKYETAQPFLPWLRGIASHVAHNYRRTQTRENRRIGIFREYAEKKLAVDEPLEAVSSVQVSQLKACIENLQPKQKQIVTLRYFEGLDSSQIGKHIGLNAAAVRLTLFRVRERLRGCVESAQLKTG
jgi:RNA polymerase sigma-70 factor (ECF subfamily)